MGNTCEELTSAILFTPLPHLDHLYSKLSVPLGATFKREWLGTSLTVQSLGLCASTAGAAAAKSLQSCPTLCNPTDGSPPGSAVPGILQARTLEWVAISFPSAWKWKVKVKSLSRVWIFPTPWTAAHQAALSMGFTRQEYWSRVPLSSAGDMGSIPSQGAKILQATWHGKRSDWFKAKTYSVLCPDTWGLAFIWNAQMGHKYKADVSGGGGRGGWWVGIQKGGPDRKSRLVPYANKGVKTGVGASNTAVLCAVTTEDSTERLWLKVMPSILCGLVHHLETKWPANNFPQALSFISFYSLQLCR